MNYLAHLFFSPSDSLSVYGNLLGDFIKGDVYGRFPDALAQGIINHRAIDRFTDAHETTHAARLLLAADMRRFSGIIIDVVYDHFLLRHWERFSAQPVSDFIAMSYRLLEEEPAGIEEDILVRIRRIREADLLSSYATLEGVDRVLKRISTRIRRANRLDQAIGTVTDNYLAIEQCFLLFFPQLMAYARHGQDDR